MKGDEQARSIWSGTQTHTVTFRYPKGFRSAMAASLGRDGWATLAEVDEFLREAIRVNVQAVIDEHGPKPAKKKLVLKKRKKLRIRRRND